MLVGELAERLHGIAADHRSLKIVETRGLLGSKDWRNEIHPNTNGYLKHAAQWRNALSKGE
jgi:hypothetical protein